MKKQTFFWSKRKLTCSLAALVLATGIFLLIQGCEKQNTNSPLPANSSVSSSAIVAVTKQQALDRLNAYFKNEFSVIKMKQVSGVNRTQFTHWLRNGQAASAENMFLSEVLSSNGNEYVILKNVFVKEAAQYASVGLIAVTPQFYNNFTRMIAVINYNNHVDEIKHICSWKKCDSYEPCPCVDWIDFVYGDCPTDKCIVNENCAHFQASDCNGELTGIKTIDVLGAF